MHGTLEQQSSALSQMDVMIPLRNTAISKNNYDLHSYNNLPFKYELKVKFQKAIIWELGGYRIIGHFCPCVVNQEYRRPYIHMFCRTENLNFIS